MRGAPLPNIVLAIGVFVLLAVEISFSWTFWGEFAGADGAHATAFKVFGVTLAIIEMLLLIVATNAALRGFPVIGWCARAVFVPVVIGNFICGLAAIATYTANDVSARQADVAQYDSAAITVGEARTRIGQLRNTLAEQDLDLPAAALRPMVDEMTARAAAQGASSETHAWRQRRLAELQAALATAEEINRLERVTREANNGRLGIGRPSDHPPYVQTLITIASWFDVVVEPEQVRNGLSLLLATILRCLLGFGLWFATGPFGKPAPSAGGGSQNTPIPANDFARQAIKRWQWPNHWLEQSRVKSSPQVAPDLQPARDTSATPRDRGAAPNQPPASARSEEGSQESKASGPRRRPKRGTPAKPRRDLFDGKDPLDDLDPTS